MVRPTAWAVGGGSREATIGAAPSLPSISSPPPPPPLVVPSTRFATRAPEAGNFKEVQDPWRVETQEMVRLGQHR